MLAALLALAAIVAVALVIAIGGSSDKASATPAANYSSGPGVRDDGGPEQGTTAQAVSGQR